MYIAASGSLSTHSQSHSRARVIELRMSPFVGHEPLAEATVSSRKDAVHAHYQIPIHPVLANVPSVATPEAPSLYEWPTENENGYRLNEQLMGQKRNLKVIVLGAGASGINFIKAAVDRLENVEVVCYEKNNDVGGTWLENV
jgi:hypothetical protein